MRHGFLLIERVPRERIKLPDGSVTDSPVGQSEATIRTWWETNVRNAPEPDPAAQAEWETALEAYRAATTIAEVEGTRGFSTEPVTVTQITYPDGHVDDRALGGPPEERIRRRFSAQNPPPSAGGSSGESFELWRRAAQGIEVASATGWRAAVALGGAQEEFDLGARESSYGLPAPEIAAKLDALAADGWEVLHVSEDRGVYVGPHAGTDSFVTRARYLLRRESA